MRRSPGFSTLETLIAFLILTITVAGLYRVAFDGTRALAEDVEAYEAAEFARSQMALFRATYHLGEVPLQGSYAETWRWRFELSDYPEAEIPPAYRTTVALHHVTLTITSMDDRPLGEFTTLYLEPLR